MKTDVSCPTPEFQPVAVTITLESPKDVMGFLRFTELTITIPAALKTVAGSGEALNFFHHLSEHRDLVRDAAYANS